MCLQDSSEGQFLGDGSFETLVLHDTIFRFQIIFTLAKDAAGN